MRKRISTRNRVASRKSLIAEIEELEGKLSSDYMDMMDGDASEDSMDWMEEEVIAEPPMDMMDDDDFDDDEMEIDVVDDSLLDEDDVIEEIEDACGGPMMASEVDPSGVEERISQDYLDAVEEVAHGTELATAPSISKVAPTKSKYASRLKSASMRLDRVAEYLEKNGRKDLALRIDKIADAVDERIKMRRK